MHIVFSALLFRMPWLRRFDGYAAWNLILLRCPIDQAGDDLLTHELCHVWQMQHRPIAMPLSYLRHGYASNPYEIEARRAVEVTRGESVSPDAAFTVSGRDAFRQP